MASPLVGSRAGPCPRCGSAEVYLRADASPQCRACRWTGSPRYDSKFLQSWSTVILPPTPFLPAPARRRLGPVPARAGLLLAAGGVAHVASIFVVLYAFQGFLALLAYEYLGWTTLLGLPIGTVGIVAQAVFAVVALGGAVIVLGGYEGGSAVFGVLGVVAVVFSLLVSGGVVGAIGGALLAGAGATLRPSSRMGGATAPA